MFLPPDQKKKVKERSTLLKCKGISGVNPEHEFLKAEGHFKCLSCFTCCCNTCGYAPSKDRDKKRTRTKSLIHYQNMNENLCVDCYQQHIFLPYSIKLDDVLSVEEMKRYLKKNNQSMPKDADAHEVQEMYEMCRITVDHDKQKERNVPFPVYPTSTLTLRTNKYKKWYSFGQVIHTFSQFSSHKTYYHHVNSE